MAESTSRLGLLLPEQTDFYNIANYNANMRKIDNAVILCQDITNIAVLTQAQYDALENPDENTLYVIAETSET